MSKIRENPKIRALLEARKPYFYIILALALISIWIWDFHLLGLFDREEPRGFIHDFQNLIGGLLAFGAGFFVWIASRETIKSDRKKDLDKYYISKASLASSFLAEFSNIKIQAEKMKLKSILKEQQDDIQQKKGNGATDYEFNGAYFFFKDVILPVYCNNTKNVGLLDPNVAKLVVTTADLIRIAIRQVELVGEFNRDSKVTPIDKAESDVNISVKSVEYAVYSIDSTCDELHKFIDKYYSRLSNVHDYF